MPSREHTPKTDKASKTQSVLKPSHRASKRAVPRQVHPAALIQRVRLHPGSWSPPDVLQQQRMLGNRAVNQLLANQYNQAVEWQGLSENTTGLPENLKAGVERLSGLSLGDVRVHYNSSRPAQLKALAYTQGREIHLAPGQERHLPHEAWHVVQQAQGQVAPTRQFQGSSINDDESLEREAEVMGGKALQGHRPAPGAPAAAVPSPRHGDASSPIVQRKIGFEFEVGGIETEHRARDGSWVAHRKGDVISDEPGYKITADINANGSQLEFVTDQFDETDDDEVDEIGDVAEFIRKDMKAIVQQANAGGGMVLASNIARINGGANDRFLLPPNVNNYLNLAGQLQMTGGVTVRALAGVVSGSSMPDRAGGAPGTRYQDYAVNYKDVAPNGDLQQPIFRAAIGAVNGFVGQADPTKGGIPGRVRGQLAAVITLMAQIPLNMRGQLPVAVQGLFLARTDYAKILKMIGDESGINLDPDTFAQALLSTINQFAAPPLRLDDDVFPAAYRSAGQQLTGVSIGRWARSVVPTPGSWWGRWQGTDLITKKHFPGTQAQKAELRAFGGFGNKTDPGNKLILEWRNLQTMYADQLVLVMTGLADYLRRANA